MAYPTAVNDQITDAVTQSSVQVPGNAATVAMANLYLGTSQALVLAAHNAAISQQNLNIVAQAVTVQGVALLYGIGAGEAAREVAELLSRPAAESGGRPAAKKKALAKAPRKASRKT